MRILIVGNDPSEIGGVANYTRPLAQEFSRLGHDVFYFYSGAWNKAYNWLFYPYLKIDRNRFPFECAELFNSPCWVYNFDNPLIDIAEPQTERVFSDYIKKIKPQIMHVHSRLGLPVSIIKLASDMGIRVFNTLHVYGLLCQKRVMIDYLGEPCNGPSDIEKCAVCTGWINTPKKKLKARLNNSWEGGFALFMQIRKKIKAQKDGNQENTEVRPVINVKTPDRRKVESLDRRLKSLITIMNESVYKTICVSEDVRKTMLSYGASAEKLLVQHIGSTIADHQKIEERVLHHPIVIGNIGGVSYYKGTHVLIDAIKKLGHGNYIVKIFGKYDQTFIDQMMKDKQSIPVEFTGRYIPKDLPDILKEIDVMVLPSICNDTAPQTIFESYSSGIPIIASDIGGFTDFIRNGENGLLFRAGDSRDLAEKISWVVEHPEKINLFRSQIPQLKRISENAKELIELYQEKESACFT